MEGVTVRVGWAADEPPVPSAGKTALAILGAALSAEPHLIGVITRDFVEAGGDIEHLVACVALWARSLTREPDRADTRTVVRVALVAMAAAEEDQ